MNELRETLETIDRLLGMISVRGDGVMLLAEARRLLKAAHGAAATPSPPAWGKEGGAEP